MSARLQFIFETNSHVTNLYIAGKYLINKRPSRQISFLTESEEILYAIRNTIIIIIPQLSIEQTNYLSCLEQ